MTTQRIGILHPGAMGISVAATLQGSGHHVYWASEGRSQSTVRRAAMYGLHDLQSVAALCAACDILFSVCPPDSAEAVAQQVLGYRFRGLYVDANAIAPQRAIRIGQAMQHAGATGVDGGIIGGPASRPGTTWLYLSGPAADVIAACCAAGPLETHVLGPELGTASALKMCYAAYSKGSTALLAAILAAAESLGVRTELQQRWSADDPAFAAGLEGRIGGAAVKAWRFAGEMEEIAATFQAAGQPDGFHTAAAFLYRQLADFKDAAAVPTLDQLLAGLQHGTRA